MIVPNFWAECRKQDRSSGKQVTVRRYGWSMESESDALHMAESRTEEALERILRGEKLRTTEPKVPYNGAEGIPIREEVLARVGDEVITRNSYGAHCLNSPRALFADIDFEPRDSLGLTLVMFAVLASGSALVGTLLSNWKLLLWLLVGSAFLAAWLAASIRRVVVALRGGMEQIARKRLMAFLSSNLTWNLRLYRTPAGYRVLVTHQPFEAGDEAVKDFFSAVQADPVYVRMCLNQRCFRARLTAKPWRIGISTHMRPRPGVWPVRPNAIPDRNEWIAQYEGIAEKFAACRYVESLGSGVTDDSLEGVVELHDRESRALLADALLA
jgi:hypothetical protein